MADVHSPPATPLSDRAQQILREAQDRLRAIGHEPNPRAEDDEVLDILQDAIAAARTHLEAIRELLDELAAHGPPR